MIRSGYRQNASQTCCCSTSSFKCIKKTFHISIRVRKTANICQSNLFYCWNSSTMQRLRCQNRKYILEVCSFLTLLAIKASLQQFPVIRLQLTFTFVPEGRRGWKRRTAGKGEAVSGQAESDVSVPSCMCF